MTAAVSPPELRAAIDADVPLAVLDIRQSLDYVHGNLLESTRVPRRDLETRLPVVVPDRSVQVVLCDQHGERAPRDARWLESLGYDRVDYLDGGIDAWAAAGYDLVEAVDGVHATAFNFGSKAFGERVEADRDLPKLSPVEVAARRDELTVVDVRNPPEYDYYETIPGSINVEGVDLALYADAIRDDEPLVVHCAGRTRSIIGTATLDALGIDNVYELENGTMGWQLAGNDLTTGPGSPRDLGIDLTEAQRAELRSHAADLLADAAVTRLDASTLADHLQTANDGTGDRPTYVFDVRTRAEYEDGHLPGARWVAGGQLIQTTARHIAVPESTIVVVSESDVRSSITAYWLDEMGYADVRLLEGGVTAWTDAGHDLVTGSDPIQSAAADRQADLVADQVADRLTDRRATHADMEATISSATLATALAGESPPTVLDIGDRDAFVDGHVPGACWVPRYELERALAEEFDAPVDLVLTCETGDVSATAAAQLRHDVTMDADGEGPDGFTFDLADVRVLEGGLAAWTAADLNVESGDDGVLFEPRQAIRKPYAQGEREMRRYLEWEETLVE